MDIDKKHEELVLLSIEDLEELLKVTRRTIDRYCKNDKLNFPKKIKVGKNSRFKKTEVKDWLNNNRVLGLYSYKIGDFTFTEEKIPNNSTVENYDFISHEEAVEIIKQLTDLVESIPQIPLKLTFYKVNNKYRVNRIELMMLKNDLEKKLSVFEQEKL